MRIEMFLHKGTTQLDQNGTSIRNIWWVSYFSLEQTMLGVKREPTDLDLRSHYGTLETFFSLLLNEKEGEIGIKRMPWVMPRIDLLVNPRGCRLPMTLIDKDVLVICP